MFFDIFKALIADVLGIRANAHAGAGVGADEEVSKFARDFHRERDDRLISDGFGHFIGDDHFIW